MAFGEWVGEKSYGMIDNPSQGGLGGGAQAGRKEIPSQGNQTGSSRVWGFWNQKASYWGTRCWEEWELGCSNAEEFQYCHKMPQIPRMKIRWSPESRAYLNQQTSDKRAQ